MEALIGIAVVVGLVWATIFVLRGSLVAGCLTFLLVNSCFGFYFFNVRVGPVELTLDRIVLVLLVAAYFIHRALGRTVPWRWGASDWTVLAFVGWLTLRTFTSDWLLAPKGHVLPVWHLIVGYPSHISDPSIGLHYGRARGPMVQAIVLGFCLSISTLCMWAYRDRLTWRGRLLSLGLIGLFLIGTICTYTRCVWIGAALGLLLVMALTLPKRVSAVLLAGVVTCGLLATATRWDQLVSLSAGRSAAHTRDSTYMRASFAYVSWQMFLDHPVLGVGLSQYVLAKDEYLSDRTSDLRLEGIRDQLLHNLPLSILVETGLVGFGLYLAMFYAWTRDAWRLWRDRRVPDWARSQGLIMLGLVVVYIPNALFQPLGHMNIVHMMFFFLAGITAALAATFQPSATKQWARPVLRPVAAELSPVGNAR
ncbi:MAG: O-antigen ligase family protein [Planctomycetes bacterium]|nr:O-antigen ligase family protein [Planctomycetota bacterium]